MSLNRLRKATGLTLAIVGLSVAHSFATEEPTISENQPDSQMAIGANDRANRISNSEHPINQFVTKISTSAVREPNL